MNFSRRLTLMAVAGITFLYPAFQAALAQQPVTVIESEADQRPPLQITIYGANRRATTADQAVATVTVIEREQLEHTPAVDLASFLRSQPGVSVQANGGQGSQATIALRGTSAAQTLVVVDGVRVSSATNGASAIQNIPLSSIERIEIVRGPRSSVYGSDAIGGVVYIFTRRGVDCPAGQSSCTTLEAGVQAPLGGYVDVQHEGRTDAGLTYGLGGRLFGTEGYNFTYPTPGPWGVDEPDDDGFLQGSVRGRASQGFGWGTLAATGSYNRGRAEFDNSPGFENLLLSETAALTVSGDVYHDDSWRSRLEAVAGMDKSLTMRDEPGFVPSRFDTYRTGVLASTTKSLVTAAGLHTFTLGAEAYRETVDSTVAFDAVARDLLAGYAQYGYQYAGWTVNLAGRYDHGAQFGGQPTFNAGIGYALTDWLSLRTSYGTGFRTPTFNDLYYPGFSNPGLLPERSGTFEVGATLTPLPGTTLDVTAYRTRIDDMIAYDPARWNVYNIGTAMIGGVEVALAHEIADGLTVRGSVDFLDPVNADTGKTLRYRPRLKASGEITYEVDDKLTLGAGAEVTGTRFADAGNATELPAVATLNASLRYDFDERTTFKLTADNLLDAEYSSVQGYRAPGRTLSLSVSSKF